jgi:hypothetical protein
MPYFHTSLFYYHSFNQDYDNEDEEWNIKIEKIDLYNILLYILLYN